MFQIEGEGDIFLGPMLAREKGIGRREWRRKRTQSRPGERREGGGEEGDRGEAAENYTEVDVDGTDLCMLGCSECISLHTGGLAQDMRRFVAASASRCIKEEDARRRKCKRRVGQVRFKE